MPIPLYSTFPTMWRELVGKIFKNVPVLDGGGRVATTTFTQRDIGDVLVTFENEVQHVRHEFGDNSEVIYPPVSILAESPGAVVDKVVDKKGIRKQATAYLQFLYTDPAQDIIAKHYFRPRSAAVFKKHEASLKAIALFTVDEIFGSWKTRKRNTSTAESTTRSSRPQNSANDVIPSCRNHAISGSTITPHVAAAIVTARNTAALPKSFAFFDKG